MTRSLPTKYKNTGLELVVAGSVTLLFNYLFTHLAFMILIGYGFYHILRTRTYPIGVTFLILGVVMWFLSHTIQFMFWVTVWEKYRVPMRRVS